MLNLGSFWSWVLCLLSFSLQICPELLRAGFWRLELGFLLLRPRLVLEQCSWHSALLHPLDEQLCLPNFIWEFGLSISKLGSSVSVAKIPVAPSLFSPGAVFLTFLSSPSTLVSSLEALAGCCS